MNTSDFRAALIISATLSALPACAHHSFFTTYDPSQSHPITGVVTEFQLKSPHSFIFMDVTNNNGDIEKLEVEMHSVPVLRRSGIDQDTIKPGDQITVIAWPNKVPGYPLVFGIALTTTDGRSLGGPPQAGERLTQEEAYADSDNEKLAGIERLQGRWLAPTPAHFPESPLPLNEAGLAAWQNYDPKLSPANTCEPESIPGLFYAPYLTEILIGEDGVEFHHESYDIRRSIPLGGEPMLADPDGQFGSTIGRVEGNELVVETSDFPASNWGLALAFDTNGAGSDIPSSAQKKLTERYSLSEDGYSLRVDYTLEDPAYLTEPFSSFVVFSREADDSPMYEFECELESAARYSRDL